MLDIPLHHHLLTHALLLTNILPEQLDGYLPLLFHTILMLPLLLTYLLHHLLLLLLHLQLLHDRNHLLHLVFVVQSHLILGVAPGVGRKHVLET